MESVLDSGAKSLSSLSSLVFYFGFYSLFDVYFSYDILFQCFLLYST